MIHQAAQIELEELLSANAHRLTADGKAAVVRNGYQPEREILTSIGPMTVRNTQGQIEGWLSDLFSFSTGTALCTQEPFTGICPTLALPERDHDR